MNATAPEAGWLRRARPLLGTLVELAVPADAPDPQAALAAGFAAIGALTQALSRHDDDSDIARLDRLAVGASLLLRPAGVRALRAAQALQAASGGLFDISLGSAPAGWRCAQGRLHKLAAGVTLDLGGIAKGLAVDDALRAMRHAGCAAGWVNAGGDLRVFGATSLPLQLRDEARGGVRAIGTLADGAFATSRYALHSRCRLHAPAGHDKTVQGHVSVAAPRCLWADALTKIVALSGDVRHPLLHRLGARAWLH